ncbi:MFS transporter [Aliirhizobium cellulosilyticum]|uniref:DHA2 family multidrug resistance protein n=1 Tax=Aliirhizobium cellulosilyticum TaxID=393664 RepID=A0A7W6UZE7_9HYPH|nr:MFS transporter [Rhizobium cellulosilyticum]MBB4349354.1 DHA2 family multidrug resistance protein [Rhizobium cellulosilyticum]MBB4412424.1 DHA2 family multidrug resistance protein [Rhizobium cellulosilyticum]MBB4447056.1 DHA2 family multidrug resistance protein [Rhizobium cellulosilyticum]
MKATVRSFGPLTSGTTAARPVLIVSALLLASFVVGFDTRVFVVGLPDLRAAYSLSVDEASWLNTVANAPQILVASAVAWFATVFGVRRVMIPTTLIYAGVSFAIPLVHTNTFLFALHGIRGLLLGVFIPATIMVIFRNLDRKYWLIGIAIYALRVPLSQNLGFVLVGFYGDYLGWQWTYWQDVIVAPMIAALLIAAAPKEEINFSLLRNADWGGMLLLGSSMTLIYVGLDQGNRLDWFQSGLVTALLVGGVLLAIGFLINESLVAHPWAHASVILSRNIGLGYAVIICFSLSSAGSSISVPGFLQNVVNLRPIAISGLYFLGAVVPSFIFITVAVTLLRRFDARLCILIGLALMALGSQLGSRLTLDWGPWNFFPTVILHTAGQSFAFFATVVYLIANSDPARATAVSAYIQVMRLGSVELATSAMATLLRQREQYHSNILDGPISAASQHLHVVLGDLQRLFGHTVRSYLESLSTVAAQIRAQANVLAYADLFILSFWAAIIGVAVVAFMGSMPMGPLHPRFDGLKRNQTDATGSN